MNKTQRNYKLVYTIPPEKEGDQPTEIVCRYPLTLELDINRNTLGQSSTATFTLMNLAKSTREKVFQDAYNINRYCFVDLYAGYNENMPLIFTGKVMSAYSGRRGNTEVTTEIQALDNDIVQSYSMHTFEAETPKKDILSTLVGDMPNVEMGAVGSLEGNINVPMVIDDPTFVAINKLTGNHAFIDLNKLHVLQDNECLGDYGIYKITSSTGMLGTPRRQDAMLELDLIFAPEIQVGQLVEIDSSISTEFNGQYKVAGIHHHGIISGQVSGELITTLTLFVGAFLPNSNYIFSGVPTAQNISVVKNNKVVPLDNATLNSIRQVRQYLIINKRPPHTKVTHSLYWDDVLYKYSSQGSIPSLDVLSNLYQVSNQLQSFVDRFYPKNKIKITSGWRSASYNRSIGGASKSAHITGRALDFYIPGQILAYVYRNLSKYWGYRRYLGNGFIHVDLAVEYGRIANDR